MQRFKIKKYMNVNCRRKCKGGNVFCSSSVPEFCPSSVPALSQLCPSSVPALFEPQYGFKKTKIHVTNQMNFIRLKKYHKQYFVVFWQFLIKEHENVLHATLKSSFQSGCPRGKKKLLKFFFPHYNGKGLVQVAMMDSGVKWQKSTKNQI